MGAAPSPGVGGSGTKRKRVFDFGDSGDSGDEKPAQHDPRQDEQSQRTNGRLAQSRPLAHGCGLGTGSTEEGSLTPACQRTQTFSPRSGPPVPPAKGDAAPVSPQSALVREQQCLDRSNPVSLVDRIFAQGKPEARPKGGQQDRKRKGIYVERGHEDALDELELDDAPPAVGGRACVPEVRDASVRQRQNPKVPMQSSSSQQTQAGSKRLASMSGVDRIWNSSFVSGQHQPGNEGLGVDESLSRSQHGQIFASQDGSFEAGARDAWRQRSMCRQRESADRTDKRMAEEHARSVLLSPPKSAARPGQKSKLRRAIDEWDGDNDEGIDGSEKDAVDSARSSAGWGAERARANGGRGSGNGKLFGMDGSVTSDARIFSNGPRILPGPAGKLGKVHGAGGRSITGQASPLVQEHHVEEQGGSREAREGIASDSIGPLLPLRKIFQAIEQHDVDFAAKSWCKMLSDLDLSPYTATAPSATTVTHQSPLLRFTVASVVRHNYVKKVPRLLVFVKNLSMEDECASATIKDPTGEMKATIHADVLDEEGDALAAGSTLVLRKVTVYNSADGMQHMLIITRNNLVRCFSPEGL